MRARIFIVNNCGESVNFFFGERTFSFYVFGDDLSVLKRKLTICINIHNATYIRSRRWLDLFCSFNLGRVVRGSHELPGARPLRIIGFVYVRFIRGGVVGANIVRPFQTHFRSFHSGRVVRGSHELPGARPLQIIGFVYVRFIRGGVVGANIVRPFQYHFITPHPPQSVVDIVNYKSPFPCQGRRSITSSVGFGSSHNHPLSRWLSLTQKHGGFIRINSE